MGPIALFDKSFLQSISTDEAVWFDHFFMPIVCPIFHVETLGNLAKKPMRGRSPEEVVSDMASKFPEWSGSPCMFHSDLVLQNLVGNPVPMHPQIPRPGGRWVKSGAEFGAIFDQTPEEEAFRRWQDGEFHEVERIAAATWRKQLDELDLVSIAKELRSLGFTQKSYRTLADAKAMADALVNGDDQPYARLKLALDFFHIPRHLQHRIAEAWRVAYRRRLPDFAPYAAFALTVELFFQIALGAGLIGGERPSNRTDIAYLFYLPFCQVFVSSDDLHRRLAPLFIRPDQTFVWGIDLKPALKAINSHFLELPVQERERGIKAFASVPPDGNLVAELWDRFMRPGYRHEKPATTRDPERDAELVKRLKEFNRQPTLDSSELTGEEELEMMSIERRVRMRRGSWWQMPKDYKEPREDG